MSIAICRNGHCPKPGGEYDTKKSTAELRGYCTKACMLKAASFHGWTEAREKKGGLSAAQTLRSLGMASVLKKQKEPALKGTELAIRPPEIEALVHRFEQTTLSFSLTIPTDVELELLKDPQKVLDEALQLPLENDADYKMMDLERTRLLDERDEIEGVRTGGTKPMNAVKRGWDAQFDGAYDARYEAAQELGRRMVAYDRAKEERVRKENAEKERLALAERMRLEEQARKKEEKAARLKDPNKKEQALRDAHVIRKAAETVPAEFTQSASASTETAGSSKANLWRGKRDQTVGVRTALVNLLSLSEDWDLEEVVGFKQSGLNALAKNMKNTRKLAGFVFEQDINLRRGGKR